MLARSQIQRGFNLAGTITKTLGFESNAFGAVRFRDVAPREDGFIEEVQCFGFREVRPC